MNLLPTRNNNILDIFLTNHPALVSDIKVIPGIIDHEAVCIECVLTVKSVPSTKRKLYLWNKADFISINHLVTELADTFLDSTIDTPMQFKIYGMPLKQYV